MDRRRFLHSTGGLLLLATLPLLHAPAVSAAPSEPRRGKLRDFWTRDRRLSLRRQTTGEQFDVVYWSQGSIVYPNYVRLCYILRDVADHDATVEMDLSLLDMLWAMQEWARQLGQRDPVITVNSGVRTRNHNAAVEGADPDSWHIYGRAADITMHGLTLSNTARMASFFGQGAVIRYPTFVHVDTRFAIAPAADSAFRPSRTNNTYSG